MVLRKVYEEAGELRCRALSTHISSSLSHILAHSRLDSTPLTRSPITPGTRPPFTYLTSPSENPTMRFSILPIFLLSLATSVLSAPSSSSPETADEVDKRTFHIKCPRGTGWRLTKCCPWDAIEWKFQCKCSDHTKSLSADGKRCENKCSQSGWKWFNTQCCPPGSDEVHGQCKVSQSSKLKKTVNH